MKAKLVLRLIRKYRVAGDLLEIGPGGGAFLRQARRYFRVSAAEFNPEQVKFLGSLGYDCRRGAFSSSFRGKKFDVIYLCDVLSHLHDPGAELRAMRAMLKPGGIVVLETGNNGDLHKKFYSLIDRWQYPDHLYFFSSRALSNLALASGFVIAEKRAHSRVAEMALDRKLGRAKSAAKGQRSAGKMTMKSRLIELAMSLKHVLDYFLVYRVGAVLPKSGRPQTVIVVFK